MKRELKEELMVRCDCGEEALLVADDYPCGFNLAMFNRCYTQYTWRNRLRLIWRIIRHGKPYTDQICLSYDRAKELVDFMNQWEKEHKDA